MSGVRTVNLEQANLVDEVLGNRDGSVVRISVDQLMAQISGVSGSIGKCFTETDAEMLGVSIPDAAELIWRLPSATAGVSPGNDQVAPRGQLTAWTRATVTGTADYFETADGALWTRAKQSSDNITAYMTEILATAFGDPAFSGIQPFASRAAFLAADVASTVILVCWVEGPLFYQAIRDASGSIIQANGTVWRDATDGSTAADRSATAADRVQTGSDAAVASAAKTLTEAARDATVLMTASIGSFAETTIAAAILAGLAAAAEGEVFHATGNDVGYIGVYRDVSGVAIELTRFPTSSSVAGEVAARKALIDQPDGFQSDRLAEFADGEGQIVAHVNADASWHMLLAQFRRADGMMLDSFEYNGDGGMVVVDEAGQIVLDPSAMPETLTTRSGVQIDVYEWNGPAGAVVVDDAGNIIVRLDGSAEELDARLSTLEDEVFAARGRTASLSARLEPAISPAGYLRQPRVGRDSLRQLRQRQARLLMGHAVQINHAIIGDSFSHLATRWSGPFTEAMVAKYGDAGGGWTGYGYQSAYSGPYAFGGSQPGLINGNARPALYPVRYSGAWDRITLGPGPDMHYVTAPVGAMLQREVPASPDHTGLELVWIATADGVVRWRVDGAAWVSLNVQGAVGTIQHANLPLTAGAHVIEIEVLSGTVKLCGDIALSVAPGYRVHKIARSGSRVSQWVSQDEAQQRAGWELLGINAWTFMEGTNSQTTPGQTAPTDWRAMMQTMIARMRAASVVADVCLFQPPDNQRPENAFPMSDYSREAQELACEQDVAFIDAQLAFGTDRMTYGWGAEFPLFSDDNLHPYPTTGGQQLVSLALEFHDFHPQGAIS